MSGDEMAFWWVNQNQTLRDEIEGGFIWSPKRNKNGDFNRFYENMKLVEPGDIILSFADQRIGHVGVATDRAVTNSKPDFGSKGENWNQEGWLVPVAWRKLIVPVRPKTLIDQLRPTLPAKYAPLTKDGNGLQSVYLAAIPEPMAGVLMQASLELDNASKTIAFEMENEPVRRVEDQVEVAIRNDTSIDSTEKRDLVLARRGQGKFRRNLEQIEQCCRLTGVSDRRFLRASHIKPWRLCENNERLDGYNGLLLTPTCDHLFDKGYISFTDEGMILLSKRFPEAVRASLGLPAAQVTDAKAFTNAHKGYLAFHLSEVFLP
jgi:putative restriction endonuclease